VQALVADTLALCAVPAPTLEENERALFVVRALEQRGATVTRDDTGNVLARFGPAEGPAAIVAAHLDTVFAADTPLDPKRDGDTLRGPGVGDNSLGLAGLLNLAARLASRAAPPTHPIVLAATIGEEGAGDLRGARALLAEVPCDAFVALEGHGLDTIQVAGIASARLRATFRGPGGHSWGARGTASTLHVLMEAGAAAIRAAGAAHINIGVAGGGTSINTIAAEASCEIDMRDADDGTLDATRDRVEKALKAAATPSDVTVTLERIGRRPGGTTATDHTLVVAARAARDHAGLDAAEETASSTDANAAMGQGIPAVSVSLTRGANAHRLDEHVQIAPMEQGLASVQALVDSLADDLS